MNVSIPQQTVTVTCGECGDPHPQDETETSSGRAYCFRCVIEMQFNDEWADEMDGSPRDADYDDFMSFLYRVMK